MIPLLQSNTHEKELGALKKSSAAVERGYEKKVKQLSFAAVCIC